MQVLIGDLGFAERLARSSEKVQVDWLTHPGWAAPEVRITDGGTSDAWFAEEGLSPASCMVCRGR
jgi:hypothetical protein